MCESVLFRDVDSFFHDDVHQTEKIKKTTHYEIQPLVTLTISNENATVDRQQKCEGEGRGSRQKFTGIYNSLG